MPDFSSPNVEPGPEQDTQVREVVALFCDPVQMEHAVQDVLTNGFEHGDLSMLAGEKTVRDTLGHRLDDTRAAADDSETPRRGYIGPATRMEGRGALASMLGYVGAVTAMGVTFATGGVLALAVGAGLLGAGAGAGLGIGLGKVYDKRLADEFEAQIAKGGILIWVRCRRPGDEERAIQVLEQHGAQHVHAHTLQPS